MQFVQFTGRRIAEKPIDPAYGLQDGFRVPIFDVEISAQKQSPFSTVVQNERAMQLYSAGFFDPQLADQSLAALDMMTFDGIEKVRDRIAQNGTTILQNKAAANGQAQGAAPEAGAIKGGTPEASQEALPRNSLAAKAKAKAASATAPK